MCASVSIAMQLNSKVLDLTDDHITDNCDYLDDANDLNSILGTESDLNIVQSNIRGLIGKQSSLIRETTVERSNMIIDLYILCETWLTENNNDKVIIPNYKYVGKHRENKKGGGVGFLIHDSMTFIERNDITLPHKSELEYLFIEIKTKKTNIVVGSLYRPPHSKEKQFIKDYKNLVTQMKKEKNKGLIMGMDHNMDLLKASKHKQTQDFLDYNLDQEMLPSITKPTRLLKTCASLLDNMFLSRNLQSLFTSGILVTDLSDHLPTLVVLKDLKEHAKSYKIITSRKINNDRIKKMDEDLNSYDWKEILSPLNAEESFEVLHKTVLQSFNTHMPEITKKVTHKTKINEPWLTKGIKISTNKLRKRYKQTLNHYNDPTILHKYRQQRRILQQIKRRAKVNYYRSKCKDFKNDTRKLWSIINSITGKTKRKETVINELKINNIKTRDSRRITNGLCDYFANVGKEFANRIPTGKHQIEHYLKKIPRNINSLFLRPTTKTEIHKIIGSLKCKNSSGYDGISNKVLKGITNSISEPLSLVFNKSMEEGVFPRNMKKADTVPLYKSKAKDEKNNYRPIALLLTISKILEKVVYRRTYGFLTKYNQIYASQYGFREGHSCQDAIAELVGEIAKNTDEGLYTIGVFLDLSKAFDTLEHNVLFEKLELYGIRGVALNWFKSYLCNRQLRVKCMVSSSQKQEYSDYKDVEYGTPQGSCLGPLLFLIFSNDLYRQLEHCNNLQFADDTTIYKGHRSIRYLTWCIEQDLDSVGEWFKANKLTLNLDKSVHMVFGKKNTTQTRITLDNIEIPRAEVTKFLGIWLDENLNWNEHLSKLKSKLKRNLHLLQTGINLLDPHTKKILYYAQLYSHLSYGLVIWGNMVTNSKMECLQKIQNRCIRRINQNEKKINTIYTKYRILKVKETLVLENCKLIYRYEQNKLPTKLKNLLETNQHGDSLLKQHKYNTRHKRLPNMARSHCKIYNTSYLCSSVKDYQKLSLNVRKADDLKKFSILLKDILLTR